ncbi:MAG: hypothetical protein JW809_19455 [Pirellulales bacterium]|nr:hypothetical protein [Pirellulales bacterium]
MNNSLITRIESRRWAEECYAAADDKGAFVERVNELHNGVPVLQEQPKLIPMTDREARMFEDMAIPFGANATNRVGDVELRYLQRLADPPSELMRRFIEDVRRYLASPAVSRMEV